MLTAVVRTALIYVLVIGTMRLMGKRQLGELQPSELVSTILISNLASISIESTELPLSASISAPMATAKAAREPRITLPLMGSSAVSAVLGCIPSRGSILP